MQLCLPELEKEERLNGFLSAIWYILNSQYTVVESVYWDSLNCGGGVWIVCHKGDIVVITTAYIVGI